MEKAVNVDCLGFDRTLSIGRFLDFNRKQTSNSTDDYSLHEDMSSNSGSDSTRHGETEDYDRSGSFDDEAYDFQFMDFIEGQKYQKDNEGDRVLRRNYSKEIEALYDYYENEAIIKKEEQAEINAVDNFFQFSLDCETNYESFPDFVLPIV